MNEWTCMALAAASALSGALISGIYIARKMRHKIAYMLDALEDHETNFRFDERKLCFRRYYRTLNRVRVLFEREHDEVKAREHFYGQILERVGTAVVVTDLSPRREGRIVYHNGAALRLLGMAAFSHIRQLGTLSGELVTLFDELADGKEQRCSFYNERGKITASFAGVCTQLLDRPVKIVTFNDVTEEAGRHEDLSWNKLIRVLTHEIMNTVTPIASLSQSLSRSLEQTEREGLDTDELKMGLDTISSSSKGLIEFVGNYRRLTRVALPQKAPLFVRDLVGQVQHLTETLVAEAGAKFEYIEKSDDILLYADAGQISQILVNLVKNALQAQATLVSITAEIDFAESVVIRVYNNGQPIDVQNQEEIFVPFYTTKSDGTGIGLSLSRQMMRLHNGALDLERSDEKGTVFRLIFR